MRDRLDKCTIWPIRHGQLAQYDTIPPATYPTFIAYIFYCLSFRNYKGSPLEAET